MSIPPIPGAFPPTCPTLWLTLWAFALLPGCPTANGPTTHDEPQVADVDWRLHDTIHTLVVVEWQQEVEATAYVEYSVDEGEWLATPARTAPAGPSEALLLGVPYNHEVTFRVVNDLGAGPLATTEHEAATGLQPGGLPEVALVQADDTRWEPGGRWLIGSINADEGDWDPGTYWRFILDRQGRYVWAAATPDERWTIFTQISRDGRDILWDESTFWSELLLGPEGVVHRTRIDGTVVTSYPTPHLQHAFVELPDGSIVWGATMGIDDQLRRVTDDGTEEVLWSCSDYLTSIGEEVDCTHNGLHYDEQRDSFLFSFYSLDTVFEIDRATGDVLHVWGHLPGAWAFDPPESAFWTQHGPSYTPDRTLLLSTHRADDDQEGVVREYELDEASGVLRQVWSFGEGQGVEMESAGEAHRLTSGNTLHNMGSGARVKEITPDGDVVWEVAWEPPRLLGSTQLVDDLYAFAP